MTHTVTGITSSRLEELRKTTINGSLSELYFTSTDSNVDGVNPILTNTGTSWTYYIGGITYMFDVTNNVTTFMFQSQGYNDTNNFIDLPIIKDPKKDNVVDVPEIINNVFIIRQSLSVFENIYRLQDVTNLSYLESYAGGRNFNIINNS